MSTDSCISHLEIGNKSGEASRTDKNSFDNIGLDDYNRCRWSTNFGDSLLFVKYDSHLLNILDVEKKTLMMKESLILCESSKNQSILR